MCGLMKSRSNALDPTLDSRERGRNADDRRSIFVEILSMKINM